MAELSGLHDMVIGTLGTLPIKQLRIICRSMPDQEHFSGMTKNSESTYHTKVIQPAERV
jgi:hypothetical protein